MGNLTMAIRLAGTDVHPVEWPDFTLDLMFEDQVQPQLVPTELTFVNEDAKLVMQWFASKPLEGMPFELFLTDKVGVVAAGEYLSIRGFIDFTKVYEVITPVMVRVSVQFEENLQLLDDKLEAVSYGYLAREGGIISKEDYVDVPVIVKRKFDFIEVAFASMALYMFSKEAREFIKTAAEGKILSVSAGLSTPTQKPASLFTVIAMAIVRIGYYAAIILSIIPLIIKLKQFLIPTKTKYKGMRLRKALEKACEHMGLELVSNINELDSVVYLPSKTDDKYLKNKREKGIPNVSDYGYRVDEMFDLCQDLFRADRMRIGNKLHLRAKKDPFWYQVSTYVMPDVLSERFRYNLNEMKSNFVLGFQFDPSDEWTMPSENQKNDYFKGVNFQVITEATAAPEKYKLTKGLEEVSIPLALGARRDKLSASETIAKVLLAASDVFLKLAGKKTNAERINEHRGALQISNNFFSVAKLVVIRDGIIPENHRDILSARKLYEEYHYWQSFYENPTMAQKRIYENVRIPFGFADFIKTSKSSYFTTWDGRKGKFRDIVWNISQDFATVTFEINGQYVKNLSETKIEA